MKLEEAIDKFKHLCEYTKQNKEKFNKVDELIEIEETLINYIEKESIPKEKVKELYEEHKKILRHYDYCNLKQDDTYHECIKMCDVLLRLLEK